MPPSIDLTRSGTRSVLAPVVLLLALLLSPVLRPASLLEAQPGTRSGAAGAAPAPGCPFAVTLPTGWTQVPLRSARMDPRRNMRFRYGSGAEDIATLAVRLTDAAMARMEREGIVRNELMALLPPLTLAGTSAVVLHSRTAADALEGRGGSDAWAVHLALDDEEVLVITLTLIANRGVRLPAAEVIRTFLSDLKPGACLSEDPAMLVTRPSRPAGAPRRAGAGH